MGDLGLVLCYVESFKLCRVSRYGFSEMVVVQSPRMLPHGKELFLMTFMIAVRNWLDLAFSSTPMHCSCLFVPL